MSSGDHSFFHNLFSQPYVGNSQYTVDLGKENDRKCSAGAAKNSINSVYAKNTLSHYFCPGRHGFLPFAMYRSPRLKASMIVEAAIALPLMIFALYILMFPLYVMDAERRIQNEMESVAKELCFAEYLKDIGEEALGEGTLGDFAGGLINGLETAAAESRVLSIDETKYLNNMSFSTDTSVFDDDSDQGGDMIYMCLSYEPAYPSALFKLMPQSLSIVTSRRAWTGSEGGRSRSKYMGDEGDAGGDSDADDGDITVYIARNSAESDVYHIDPNCHYISNSTMQSADASLMGSLTNESGAGYHSCPCCQPGSTGTVYYFPDGTAYHSSPDCKAITSYVTECKLSTLEGKHVCSYCGGK